jgi:Tfp pilus assembly protein PilF
LVLIVFYFPVLEYIYRTGETMTTKTYRRWRWMGPTLIMAVYALFWVQAPPKIQPLRIALIAEPTDNPSDWRVFSQIDLTRRRLIPSRQNIVVNPWAGSSGEYPAPDARCLENAKYRVYRFVCPDSVKGDPVSIEVTFPGNDVKAYPCYGDNLSDVSARIARDILQDAGKKIEPAEGFPRSVSAEVLNYFYHGWGTLAEGRPNAARGYFERSLEADSTFTPARIARARAWEETGRMDSSEVDYLRAVRAPDASAETFLLTGEFYLRSRTWNRAEPPLKIALTRNPLLVRAHYDLAQLHPGRLEDLRINNPIGLLEEAVRLDPAFENARLALADKLLKSTAGYRALDVIREGLEINPQSVALHLKLGALQFYNGDPDNASKTYRRIFEFDPENSAAAFNLGVVAYRTDQYDDAEGWFRKSLDWGGTPDNYYYLGLIYRKAGDKDRARQCFLKRWELRKDDQEAYALKAKEYAEALQ